jgi:adenylyl-sulfate kinase
MSASSVVPGGGSGTGLRTVTGAPTVWFTGLSGAGKTTIARALASQLEQLGIAHALLDGDELRATLSADLGFSRDDRAEQVRRVGHLARILTDAGVISLVALVSPYRTDRESVRALHEPGRFLEVHVATPLETCAQRDVKGLYARARDGELEQLTGVEQDYEPPERAELTLDGSDGTDIVTLATRVLEAVRTVVGRDEG